MQLGATNRSALCREELYAILPDPPNENLLAVDIGTLAVLNFASPDDGSTVSFTMFLLP
jgi:hypothetical protein